MYIEFEYQRVPDFKFLRHSKKGRPHPALLYEYRKGFGFAELSEKVKPYSKGGAVICCLVGDNWMLVGSTICSMSDTFSYKTGREIALLRATNLGLGHELDSGLMFRLDGWDKLIDNLKIRLIAYCIDNYKNRLNSSPNTLYFHPETAKITSEMDGFRIKTSKIILKNHVWMGFEAE